MARRKSPIFVTLLGKRWRLRYVPLKKIWGDCDHPTTQCKEIRIASQATGIAELDVLCHEFFHGLFPQLNEDTVNQAATDIARALWRLGYQKEKTN